MKTFDEKNATEDELWMYCMEEYENQNPIAKKLFNNYYDKIFRILKQIDSKYRILEVGCAAGESSRRIERMLNGQYFEASEYEGRLVNKLIETNPPFKVTQESVYEMHRKDNEFDCVFLLEVLEHLENPEAALKELYRVASRYVVVSVPNEPLWSILNLLREKYIGNLGNTPGHINRWSPGAFKKLVSKFGKIIEVYKPIPWTIIFSETNSCDR
jgi:2-polyprenyl-3-methyl-5-hydroxy-6-metoxy-1,4-benzoquinol methylase